MRNFILKFIIFFILIYFLQLAIVQIFPVRVPVNLKSITSNSYDVLYFGDSSVLYFSNKDKNKSSTADIFQKILGERFKILKLASPAWNSTVFEMYSNYLSKNKILAKTVIVPINLRSFSVDWDLYPAYQFNDDMIYFEYYDTFLSPFIGVISNLTLADVNQKYNFLHENSLVYDGEIALGKAKNFENMSKDIPYSVRLKKSITLYYLSNIQKKHRKLLSLVKIAKNFKKNGVNLIYYITPIDYQTGERYLGKKFVDRISDNIDTIISELRKENVTIVNYSFDLKTDKFTWRENGGEYPNEHLNYAGRLFVASELSKIIKSL